MTGKELLDILHEERMKVKVKLISAKWSKYYDILYNNEELENTIDRYGFWQMLIDKAEEYFNSKDGAEFMKFWYKENKDIISSDREMIAFAIAMEL